MMISKLKKLLIWFNYHKMLLIYKNAFVSLSLTSKLEFIINFLKSIHYNKFTTKIIVTCFFAAIVGCVSQKADRPTACQFLKTIVSELP
jgi:hypothetical protein